MTATIYDSVAPVKSASHFGRGIDPRRSTRFEPSDEDRAWAAECFDQLEQERQLEERYQQARWDAQFDGSLPAGLCELCGEPSDWLDPIYKLCGDCLTAAENATIAGQNKAAMGQYRVF